MKKIDLLFTTIFLLLTPFYVHSTHLMGGEFTYNFAGNYNYEIRLTVYRDCFNGIATFDDPVTIGVFNSNDSLINTLSISLTTISNLPDTLNCLLQTPSYICYEKGIYDSVISLPALPGGYKLVYQRCCRQADNLNVENPNTNGTTLMMEIPDSVYAINSSPSFVNSPFKFMCTNTNFSFDNSAMNDEGDSIAYSLYTPLNGGSTSIPIPNPPSNPPYASINWEAGYSLTNLIGGQPLTIDVSTGLLTATPDHEGLFTIGVCAREYRNGYYLGQILRDISFYVVLGTSTTERDELSLSFTPNPVHDKSLIEIPEKLKSVVHELLIFDMTGKLVRSITTIPDEEIIIDRSNLKNGIYYYRLLTEGKSISSGKFSVQ